MVSSEEKLLKKFKARHSCDQGKETWIETAQSFLENLTSQTEDYEDASSFLAASGWSEEGLNILAYASFCFWHLPLELSKEAGPSATRPWYASLRKNAFQCREDVSRKANKRVAAFVCQKDLSPSARANWVKVNHCLALASVALKAVSLREATKKGKAWSFQAEMLRVLPQRLAEDRYLIKVAKKWPDCQAFCVQNNMDAVSFEEVFSKVNLRKISKRAAKIFCDTANDLSRKDFGGVSSVRAFFPKDRKGEAGCYYYSRRKGHLVLPDSFWPTMQTLPAFLSFTAHEVLHMHQMRSMEIKPNPSSPFYAEYLRGRMDLRAIDFSCDTYPVPGPREGRAKLPNLAYAYRPKEFFAYQFGDALQMVLAEKFGTHFVTPCFDTGYAEFARAAGVPCTTNLRNG